MELVAETHHYMFNDVAGYIQPRRGPAGTQELQLVMLKKKNIPNQMFLNCFSFLCALSDSNL